MRFLTTVYPELKHFHSQRLQQLALRVATKHVWMHVDIWLPILIAFVISLVGVFILPSIGVPIEYRGVVRGGVQLIFLATFLICMCWRFRKHVRRNLRGLLNLGGPFICENCCYPLEQSLSETCPECGASVKPIL